MERETTTNNTSLKTVFGCEEKAFSEGNGDEGRERQLRTVKDAQSEIKTICWALSLGPDHPDCGFFREGQCPKCSSCNDEFHFLHYTSEATGYCVKCYLDRFCDVVDDENVFRVIIKRTGRALIEIINS